MTDVSVAPARCCGSAAERLDRSHARERRDVRIGVAVPGEGAQLRLGPPAGEGARQLVGRTGDRGARLAVTGERRWESPTSTRSGATPSAAQPPPTIGA